MDAEAKHVCACATVKELDANAVCMCVRLQVRRRWMRCKACVCMCNFKEPDANAVGACACLQLRREVDAEAKRVLEAVGIKEELMGVSKKTSWRASAPGKWNERGAYQGLGEFVKALLRLPKPAASHHAHT
eukprot:732728-Pelagomonas_calceolata.AAC.2